MAGKNPERRIVAAFLAAILFLAPASALLSGQEDKPAPNPYLLNGDYLRKFSLDARDTLTTPLSWGGNDFLRCGIFLGATAALYAGDRSITDKIREQETPSTGDAIVAKLGNGFFLFGYSAALYFVGDIFDSPSIRKTALVGFEAFVVSSAVVLALKGIIGRARPAAHEGTQSFHPFSIADKYASFPSGDTAGAFAVAAVIVAQSRSFLVGALIYSLAGLVALNRVHDGKHWPSDIFAGAVIGYFIGHKIADLNLDNPEAKVRLSLEPSALGPGIAVALRF